MGREGEVVAELLPEFHRAHPGIKVEVQQIPWSAAHEKLLTAFVGDATPDIAMLGNTWVPEFVALDALEPLGLTEDSFAAVATEVPAVGHSGGPVPDLHLRFGADLSPGDRVESLRDAVADRIHRSYVRGHGRHGTISAPAASSVARREHAGEQDARGSDKRSGVGAYAHAARSGIRGCAPGGISRSSARCVTAGAA